VGAHSYGRALGDNSPTTFDGTMGAGAAIYIGGDGATQEPFGAIKNVRIWNRALSAAQLQAITA